MRDILEVGWQNCLERAQNFFEGVLGDVEALELTHRGHVGRARLVLEQRALAEVLRSEKWLVGILLMVPSALSSILQATVMQRVVTQMQSSKWE